MRVTLTESQYRQNGSTDLHTIFEGFYYKRHTVKIARPRTPPPASFSISANEPSIAYLLKSARTRACERFAGRKRALVCDCLIPVKPPALVCHVQEVAGYITSTQPQNVMNSVTKQ